ncbi:hypothetical protein CRUP_019388 [Coryphaenoides rupestris]|nr:hypothetical protein CRUP_019388 [Coryphaenoides rupestris]
MTSIQITVTTLSNSSICILLRSSIPGCHGNRLSARGQLGVSGRSTATRCSEDIWPDGTARTTIRAENELEANRLANNYKFGFRKWKNHVTQRPMEDRSVEVRELYSALNVLGDGATAGRSKVPPCEAIPEELGGGGDDPDWVTEETTPLLACVISWLLVFTIPVAKMNGRTLTTTDTSDTKVVLCYILPLVLVMLVLGYMDHTNHYTSMGAKFATSIISIIPLSYYIGMGIASISAQSNFAVGAVVNATFGSITEITFYITVLLQGHLAQSRCFDELVKSALTGTLLGCILFIPRFNSRSAGVSSALLFISIGGVFAPTLFTKAFGGLVCEGCTGVPGNASIPFICKDCYYDTHTHIYDIHVSEGPAGQGGGPIPGERGVGDPGGRGHHYPHGGVEGLPKVATCINANFVTTSFGTKVGHHVVHWSRWRALAVLIVATLLMAACADLTTQNIHPILSYNVSQYFIGVTVLAMVPELPEIVNGIQFALQNNISLSLEVGSCIAVQVCMIQIPLLVLFNAFYDVGFVLVFSDIHLWASIFSVILVNYIFMDGKSDYFQGTSMSVNPGHDTHDLV